MKKIILAIVTIAVVMFIAISERTSKVFKLKHFTVEEKNSKKFMFEPNDKSVKRFSMLILGPDDNRNFQQIKPDWLDGDYLHIEDAMYLDTIYEITIADTLLQHIGASKDLADRLLPVLVMQFK